MLALGSSSRQVFRLPAASRHLPTADHFSGDCIDRVTPVPIPNTVVKPV